MSWWRPVLRRIRRLETDYARAHAAMACVCHARLALYAVAVGTVIVIGGFVAGGCGYTPGATRLGNFPPPAENWKVPNFLDANDCKECHPIHYEEWRTSMHAYAQNSPVFVAFNNFVVRGSGGTLGVFCDRCHTPIGVSAGESPILPNDRRTMVSLQSVACITCHSINTRDGQASGFFRNPIPGDPEPIR